MHEVSIDSPWQILDFAVHGSELSRTTPKITGDEDAGCVMPDSGECYKTTDCSNEDKGRLVQNPVTSQ